MTDQPFHQTSAARPCPICGKPATGRHGPFCSLRCARLDLGRWLGGTYRVETDEPPEIDRVCDED